MGCGCGGGGKKRGNSRIVQSGRLASTPRTPIFRSPAPQITPQPQTFGMINLPTPQVNNETAQKRIKELNRQAVRRARGLN